MSYLRKLNYKIVPKESYHISRNCSGCGCKSTYVNTNRFRVNANGNRVDVWLIYQCETCKHTYNLAIYERQNPLNIPQEEYEKFLENNQELAQRYGTDKAFFSKNRAEIELKSLDYELIMEQNVVLRAGDLIEVDNSCDVTIRADKLVADMLHITRSQEKKLEKEEIIRVEKLALEHKIQIWI